MAARAFRLHAIADLICPGDRYDGSWPTLSPSTAQPGARRHRANRSQVSTSGRSSSPGDGLIASCGFMASPTAGECQCLWRPRLRSALHPAPARLRRAEQRQRLLSEGWASPAPAHARPRPPVCTMRRPSHCRAEAGSERLPVANQLAVDEFGREDGRALSAPYPPTMENRTLLRVAPQLPARRHPMGTPPRELPRHGPARPCAVPAAGVYEMTSR